MTMYGLPFESVATSKTRVTRSPAFCCRLRLADEAKDGVAVARDLRTKET